jgi:RHS repeat-associated protein
MASPVTYDAAGNMTSWGGKTYSWTRENRMLTTTGTGINRSYVYTSDGERVLDRNNLDSTRTLWIRDLSGKVLREYARTGAGVWSWSKDYVLRDGQQAATVTAAATRHLHLDHLGTVRRMTDTQATPQLLTAASRDLYPFGLEATSSTDPERMRFTGHQRDTQGTTTQADDVDYMHARYYNPNVARFLSVDPITDVKRALKAPQMWNKYAYVANNPLKFIDPTGKLFELTTEFEKRLENDPEFKKAYEAWKGSKEGAALYGKLDTDKNTTYVFTIGKTKDSNVYKPGPGGETHGNTAPGLPVRTTKDWKNDAATVTSTINVDYTTRLMGEMGQSSRLFKELADSLFHEALHAWDWGGAVRNQGEMDRHSLLIDQGIEPSQTQFRLDIEY